jgi:hypothetical protein
VKSSRSAWWITSLCLSLAALAIAANSRPIKKPIYDPKADVVALFDGMESGSLDVSVIANNDLSVNLFFTNKTDRPLTVKLPEAVAAVQVLKQVQGPGGQFGTGNGTGQGQGNSRPSQGVGFGFGQGPGGGGNRGQQGGGNPFQGQAFFSIPAEKVVMLSEKGLCLNHGRPNPKPKLTYKLVPLDTVNDSPVLADVIRSHAAGSVATPVAQAAAWHVANNLTWRELETKMIDHLGRPDSPYFTRAQVDAARKVIEQAEERVATRKVTSPPSVSQR